MVQEPFELRDPMEAASSSSAQSSRVGDGCYVTATVNNKRYYGVLIDQAALKAASLLYFQDEASGLDLNRRMKALNRDTGESHPSERLDLEPAPGDESSYNAASRKRIKMEESSPVVKGGTGTGRQVQKFRYVEPETNGGSSQGYRLLLATYADTMAAAEDDVEKASQIETACQSGGKFVGNHYYQYEVRVLLSASL